MTTTIMTPTSAWPATSRLAGWAAIAVAVTIWAGFALSIRAIGASTLAPADVALIRFGLPVLILAPWLASRLPALRRVRPLDAALVALGAGLPFFFTASWGGGLTSAAHVGALIAGTTPLSVALLAFLIDRTAVSRARGRALALILGGVALLMAGQGALDGAALGGAGLLLGASLMWSAYTLGLRRAGLDPIGCTLLLCLPSLAALGAMIATGTVETRIMTVSFTEILPFLVVQGLGVGVLASLAYAAAIARLGPATCAAVGSLAPALAALGAVPLLGESLTPMILAGIAIVTLGVFRAARS
ncbi:EamA family transporter [Limimaricola variabilis]